MDACVILVFYLYERKKLKTYKNQVCRRMDIFVNQVWHSLYINDMHKWLWPFMPVKSFCPACLCTAAGLSASRAFRCSGA